MYAEADILLLLQMHTAIARVAAQIIVLYASPCMSEIVNRHLPRLAALCNVQMKKLSDHQVRYLESTQRLDFYPNQVFADGRCLLQQYQIDNWLRTLYLQLRQLAQRWSGLRHELVG